jgi:hypothetical protein
VVHAGCHVPAVRTTFTRRLITQIRIHTRRISSASPLLTSRVAGPNSVREAREASPGFAVFMIEGIVCRRNAVGLGVWMFVRDHIDGGEGVRSEATRARSDASTGKGKVQQRLEGCAELFRRGRFGHLPQAKRPFTPERLIRIALCKPFTQSTKSIVIADSRRRS